MSVGIDSGGDCHTLLVDLLGRLRIYDEWDAYLTADVTDDDSDKTFAVPTDYEWIIQSIFVDITTTATVGDRQITVEIQDGSTNVLAVVKAGAVQAASLQLYYTFAPQLPDLTSFRDTSFLMTPLPDIILDEAYVIRVYDSAAVDAAADDMHVQIIVKRRAKES